MPQVLVDIPALYSALDGARQARQMSWRQLAAQIDVSPSTLSRLANGHNPDVNAFAAMTTWLKVPGEDFIRDPDHADSPVVDEPELAAQLAPLLRSRSDLDARQVKYLQDVITAAVRHFREQRQAAAE